LDHINTPGGASDTFTSTRHTKAVVGRHVYQSRRIVVVDAGEGRNAGEGHQRRHGRMVPDGLTALSVGKAGAGETLMSNFSSGARMNLELPMVYTE